MQYMTHWVSENFDIFKRPKVSISVSSNCRVIKIVLIHIGIFQKNIISRDNFLNFHSLFLWYRRLFITYIRRHVVIKGLNLLLSLSIIYLVQPNLSWLRMARFLRILYPHFIVVNSTLTRHYFFPEFILTQFIFIRQILTPHNKYRIFL